MGKIQKMPHFWPDSQTFGFFFVKNIEIIYVPNIELLSDDRKSKRLSASNVTPLNDQNGKSSEIREKAEKTLGSS